MTLTLEIKVMVMMHLNEAAHLAGIEPSTISLAQYVSADCLILALVAEPRTVHCRLGSLLSK